MIRHTAKPCISLPKVFPEWIIGIPGQVWPCWQCRVVQFLFIRCGKIPIRKVIHRTKYGPERQGYRVGSLRMGSLARPNDSEKNARLSLDSDGPMACWPTARRWRASQTVQLTPGNTPRQCLTAWLLVVRTPQRCPTCRQGQLRNGRKQVGLCIFPSDS